MDNGVHPTDRIDLVGQCPPFGCVLKIPNDHADGATGFGQARRAHVVSGVQYNLVTLVDERSRGGHT